MVVDARAVVWSILPYPFVSSKLVLQRDFDLRNQGFNFTTKNVRLSESFLVQN